MVCTRKKDYGEPPLRLRQPAPTPLHAIMKPDAAAVAGNDNQDESKEPHTDKKEPYSEFTLFSKLPCELRLEVWKHSMAPRLVVVAPKTLGERRLQYSRKMLPVQFSVNSEARECALRRYNLRFTIRISATDPRPPTHYLELFRGDRHHAHVVMSPDDTLGFLGWEAVRIGSDLERRWHFRVEHSNATSPWHSRNKPTTSGAQPEVKNVVCLGKAHVSNTNVVHDLDLTASRNLDSIPYQKFATTRKFGSPWFSFWEEIYFDDNLQIPYFKSVGNLEEFGRFVLPWLRCSGTIWRFELGCMPPTSESDPFARMV